jgi:hypothetical protein
MEAKRTLDLPVFVRADAFKSLLLPVVGKTPACFVPAFVVKPPPARAIRC